MPALTFASFFFRDRNPPSTPPPLHSLVRYGAVGSAAIAPGLAVDVKYGRRWFKAVVERGRGRGCFDVRFATGEREAGVPSARIRPPARAVPAALPVSGLPHGWPFVAVPLLHGATPVGALGADSFERVPRSHDREEQPEVRGGGSATDPPFFSARIAPLFMPPPPWSPIIRAPPLSPSVSHG